MSVLLDLALMVEPARIYQEVTSATANQDLSENTVRLVGAHNA